MKIGKYLSNKIIVCIFLTSLIMIACGTGKEPNTIRSNPEIDGIIPDSLTAIRVAEDIWLPIYGEDINQSRPFTALLSDSIWTVSGTLPEGMLGGVPILEIDMRTGCVYKVMHTK